MEDLYYLPPAGDEGRTHAFFEPPESPVKGFSERFLKHVTSGKLEVFLTFPDQNLRLGLVIFNDHAAP